MKRFRNKEKRCTIFNKNKNARYDYNGHFFYVLLSKKSGENPDDNCDDKNHNKNPDSHSGFKNISNNFAACK
ncbi:hypothetical protein IW19_08860 [Flavobacterium reichenbachii]|uniref:Uncharacterized protein n=1 Tax=Flavobacterium reichenbachii TaxID=362418 RepID=A0A085ZMF5_9FLAO|nr:hypothetical protein IW19_08860 [Flavobacterium reichenbachii]